jgi:hypothetical protein
VHVCVQPSLDIPRELVPTQYLQISQYNILGVCTHLCVQSSLGIPRALVTGTLADTKILGCTRPLYKMVQTQVDYL